MSHHDKASQQGEHPIQSNHSMVLCADNTFDVVGGRGGLEGTLILL